MKHCIRTALVVIPLVSFAAGLVVAAESIPFSLKRGIPEIEVIINDSIKATFVIDTGADHVYIDKTFAEKHGLLSGRTQAMRPTRGSLGISEAKLFRVESLKFGDISLSDLSMVAIDLVSQIKDTSMGYPDGVLGYSFLKNYVIEIMYGGQETFNKDIEDSIFAHPFIKFHKNGFELPNYFIFEEIPFEIERHLIIINATLNGLTTKRFILDLGSSYSLFSPNLVQELKLKNNSGYLSIDSIKLDAVLAKSENVRVLERDMGKLNHEVANLNIEGVLGTTFLIDNYLFIDFSKKKIFFAVLPVY